MNKIFLVGRLVRDPEIRYTGGDDSKAIAKYTLAVPRVKKTDDSSKTDYFRCSVFGKGAEFAEKYLVKGMKLLVTGRVHFGSYTNKEGQTVYTTDVLVDDQEMCESKNAFNELVAAIERPAYKGDFSELSKEEEENLPFK